MEIRLRDSKARRFSMEYLMLPAHEIPVHLIYYFSMLAIFASALPALIVWWCHHLNCPLLAVDHSRLLLLLTWNSLPET
jgi:hypothetical protein